MRSRTSSLGTYQKHQKGVRGEAGLGGGRGGHLAPSHAKGA